MSKIEVENEQTGIKRKEWESSLKCNEMKMTAKPDIMNISRSNARKYTDKNIIYDINIKTNMKYLENHE